MVGFGTKKPPSEDCYGKCKGSSKENQHTQPRAVMNPSTVDASLADPLHTGKTNMRDYVDSMDSAFPPAGRSKAQSEGKQFMFSGRPACCTPAVRFSVHERELVQLLLR